MLLLLLFWVKGKAVVVVLDDEVKGVVDVVDVIVVRYTFVIYFILRHPTEGEELVAATHHRYVVCLVFHHHRHQDVRFRFRFPFRFLPSHSSCGSCHFWMKMTMMMMMMLIVMTIMMTKHDLVTAVGGVPAVLFLRSFANIVVIRYYYFSFYPCRMTSLPVVQ